MIDWHAPMQQSFEYYLVDPGTWRDKSRLYDIKSATITRDVSSETMGSASLDAVNLYGEDYVRIYLVAIQNGMTYKYPLATVLVQTPSSSHDGMVHTVSIDAYTPLIELKENQPPLGYYTPEDTNVMNAAYLLTREHVRAPVVEGLSDITVQRDFISNSDDTWLSYISDLAANAKYYLDLDEMGRILFSPKQDTASLQPIWTYTDDNTSIVYADFKLDHDYYDIPNVVEVVYSDDNDTYYACVKNTDEGSPVSIQKRGREITKRITNPEISGTPTQAMIDAYAKDSLKELSTLEYTIKYSHGYCPVQLGNCVLLNFDSLDLRFVKARVTSQSIKCEVGCKVTETAVFTKKLWG